MIEESLAMSQAAQQVPKEFYYPLVVAVVMFFGHGWKIKQLEKDLDAAKALHQEDRDKLWLKFDTMQTSLTIVIQTLARLEGKLDGRRDTNP